MWWLAISAAAGAIAGGIGKYQESEREKAALRQQKEMAWQQYLYGKEHSDTQFNIQKTAALEQLGVQRKNLDEQVGLSMDEYNTALLAQAFGIQDARIQTGSAVGASLASEGASGVRGSSSAAKAREYALQGLERNIDVQDRQSRNQLNKMMSGANMTLDAIGREEASWMPGGYKVQAKTAQDSYNLSIANLGQSNFNWQIGQATPTFLDYFSSVMGGGSSGIQLGNSINNYRNAWNSVGA